MRALLATATAVLLLGSLTSCSDDDPQPRLEPSTDSPAPTSSPPSSAPPSTNPPDDETAEQFILRWQDEEYAMQNNGDTSVYRDMARGCSSCDNLATRVDAIYAAGGSIRCQGGQILGLTETGRSGRVIVFEYTLRSRPTVIHESAGSPVTRLPGGKARYQVNVLASPSGFSIVSATALS